MTKDQRQAATCEGKQAFETPALAHRIARRKKRHVYRCKFCGKWHIAEKSK